MLSFSKFNETANSYNGSNYNDGDEGLGTGQLFRRPIADEEIKDPGMYSFFGLTDDSAKALEQWAKEQGIPNVLSPEKFHSTCIYSTKTVNGYEPYKEKVQLDPGTFSIAILSHSLVLKYSASAPESQLKKARSLGATSDFPEYTPHITLSYDPGNFAWSDLPVPNIKIEFEREYVQTLDKDELQKESINTSLERIWSKAATHVSKWVQHGVGRAALTKYAKMTTGPLKIFHPGHVTVHRGRNDDSVDHKQVGASFSKSKEVAKKYAGKDGDVVSTKIHPKIPALDINKILGKSLKDKEVFVAK